MAKKDRAARRRDRNIESHKLSADGRITDEIIIDVDDVYKSFRVYFDKGSMLKEQFVNPARSRYENREILKGVSFQIRRGETVALIGNNGCGKSTTLKMLTKILYPNKGTVTVNGKVSSLIELGAGFHPDMSGRENIYINASILGLSRSEIDKRVDEIIRFSELEEYIDNPIRTYSSGMYMRLAFAVAINVDAEILLIDEILAVGDQSFQEKCIARLNELRSSGVTVVLVSHSMGQVNSIADRCIWIDDGRVAADGPTTVVCHQYEHEMELRRSRRDRLEEAERKEEIEALEAVTEEIITDNKKDKQIEKEIRRKAFSDRWKSDGMKGLPIAGVFAILCILLCHASQDVYGIGYSDVNNIYPDLTWKMKIAGFTIFSAGRIGIPLVLMVVGYKWLPEEMNSVKDVASFWVKKFLPMLLAWEIWVFIYQGFYSVSEGQVFSVSNWFRQALFISTGDMSHMWFGRVFFIFMFLSPIISKMVQGIGAGKYRLLMILWWILFFMFPGFDLYGRANGGPASFTVDLSIMGYLFYFGMGYLFSLYARRFIKGSKEVVLVPILLVATVLSQFFMQSRGLSYLVWYNYYLVALMAILGFDIVARMRFGDRIMKIITSIYECSVGIFFIHRPIQMILNQKIFLLIGGKFAFKTMLLWITSFIISYIIIWCIRKVPVVGRIMTGVVIQGESE